MLITVQNIVDTAITLADMKYSQFIDTSGLPGTELVNYVNMAYKDLYQQIILAKEFYYTTTTSFSLVSGQSVYSLPDDFYKLDGVDIQINAGNQNNKFTLRPSTFLERNRYNNYGVIPVAPVGQVYRYILYASSIEFIPIPSGSNTIIMYYTPEPVTVTFDTELNMPIGSDEYMSLYCARMMLAKEETDTAPFDQKMMLVKDQICNSFKDRDEGSQTYVVDQSTINAGAIYPGFGLMGGGGY